MSTMYDYIVLPEQNGYAIESKKSGYQYEMLIDTAIDYSKPFASCKLYNNLYVFLDGHLVVSLPSDLDLLFKEIQKSKYMLSLGDDWDDQGSIAYEKSTWIEAIRFIVKYFIWVKENIGKPILVPGIYHGKDGGIDFLWDNSNLKMLVRLDKQVAKAVFYYEVATGQSSEGYFNIQDINYYMIPHPVQS